MLAILFCCAAALPPAAASQERDAPEYELKAAFLYNFATFVEWPAGSFPGPDSPFTIGVIGQDPFSPSLETTLQGKTVGGRRIEVRRSSDVKELKVCHLLFVPASEGERVPNILEALRGTSILTVGESPGFAAQVGCVNFFIEGKRVKFEINPGAAKRANLKVSSKLLRLARVVEGKD